MPRGQLLDVKGEALYRYRVRDRKDQILSVDLRSPSETWGGPASLMTFLLPTRFCSRKPSPSSMPCLEGSLLLVHNEHVLVTRVGGSVHVCSAGLPHVLRASYLFQA